MFIACGRSVLISCWKSSIDSQESIFREIKTSQPKTNRKPNQPRSRIINHLKGADYSFMAFFRRLSSQHCNLWLIKLLSTSVWNVVAQRCRAESIARTASLEWIPIMNRLWRSFFQRRTIKKKNFHLIKLDYRFTSTVNKNNLRTLNPTRQA